MQQYIIKLQYVFIILLCIGFVNAQKLPKPSKYGINIIYLSEKTKTDKEQLLDYIQYIKLYHNGKIPLCENNTDSICNIKCKDLNSLPDSTLSDFTLTDVIEIPITNCYEIVNRKIKKIKVYKLKFIDNQGALYYIISIDKKIENGLKLTIGNTYELLLLPYFGKDLSSITEGELKSLLIDNVWITQVYVNNVNIYTSPNLKGLYYIPPEKVKE